MVLTQQGRSVGLFTSRQDAESALNELKESGFSLEKLGMITKESGRPAQRGNAEITAHVGNQTQEGATTGSAISTDRGGIGGLLVGFGTLAIPGVGRVIEAGTGETGLGSTLGGKAIGAFPDTWAGALTGIGIPEERAGIYSDRVSRGDYLVMVQGTDEEIAKAQQILSARGVQDWETY